MTQPHQGFNEIPPDRNPAEAPLAAAAAEPPAELPSAELPSAQPLSTAVDMASASPVTFYDATDPHAIPARNYAALYFDGLYGPAGQAAGYLFTHRRWITIGADFLHCGIIDFEPGNPCFAVPALLNHFLAGRAAMSRPARIYCDRVDAAKAAAYSVGFDPLWWIATLDDRQWTAAELAADMATNFGVEIPADRIWANQNQARGIWDSSRLFGTW